MPCHLLVDQKNKNTFSLVVDRDGSNDHPGIDDALILENRLIKMALDTARKGTTEKLSCIRFRKEHEFCLVAIDLSESVPIFIFVEELQAFATFFSPAENSNVLASWDYTGY